MAPEPPLVVTTIEEAVGAWTHAGQGAIGVGVIEPDTFRIVPAFDKW